MENKKYEKYNILEDTSIFNGYFQNNVIDVNILRRLARDLGFSYELYTTLYSISPESADTMVKSMSKQSDHTEILLLLDIVKSSVVNYSLDVERPPITNFEFDKRVKSLAETSTDICISETAYHPEDTTCSIILKKKLPISVEEKYEGKDSKLSEYQVGILLVNDEVNSVYSRLVIYVEDQPLYLPASYYSATTSRYRRSTESSLEALELLMLKIIEDLRDDALASKIQELHYRYRANKYIYSTYEEYNTLIRVLRKIPSIIEDNSIIESLLSKCEEFERKYSHLEDQRNSYIWRCTALSDIPLGVLISTTSRILSDFSAPAVEYKDIRELLGSYVSTNRIAEEIAKEDMR